MPLTPGTRLGAYELVALIGEGGMGEVYRATDTNLKRSVAIKVLPELLSSDLDRLARFQREAEVLATLNHPHIAQIYGLERLRPRRAEDEQIRGEVSASARAGGGAPAPLKEVDSPTIALVMELVEGPTLADRIAQGPLPLDEALATAKQIAAALEAAHEQGIVHRDLKPANIKIRPDGTVKVLDFGLAKAGAGEAGGPDRGGGNFSMSPTLTSPAMTQAGIILGTAAYMAPEQARGKVVDKRADIFAFGCVLYEMLAGRRAFEGEDITDTLARVVRDSTDLTAVPVKVRRLLAKCLEKDPKSRLRDIGDAWELLDEGADPAAAAAAPPRVRWLPWAVTALAVVIAVGLGFVFFNQRGEPERSLRLSIPVPAGNPVGFLDLSPDGKRVVLSIMREGVLQLYVRALDSGDLQPLAGTATARNPFWSPDSRFIGFFADGKLKVVPAAGGPAQVLCADTGSGSGGTWSRNGVILFSNDSSQLRRVAAGGGDCKAVGNAEGSLARMPVFLPDGDHFFYAGGKTNDAASRGVYLATLEEPAGRKVLADQSSVAYAPAVRAGERAHLLFLRENRLMAQPFDEARLEVIGDPFAVAARGSFAWTSPQVAAAASADGTLVYLAGPSTDAQLIWVDRTGKALGTVGPRGQQRSVALSPDGSGVLINRQAPGDSPALWLHDLVRGSDRRLTAAGSTAGVGIWAPDSRRIAFGLTTPDEFGWFVRDLSAEQALLRKGDRGTPRTLSDWSRDGRLLVYTQTDPKSRADIWYVPFDSGSVNEQGAVKLLGTEAIESQGQLSPDGKWLAYVSNETGLFHVYVRPFPAGSSAWKVSVDSGQEPRWGRDGKELFFLSNSRGGSGTPLMATTAEPDGQGGLRFGVPHELFETHGMTYVAQSNSFLFSPHPDGQRFLVNAGVEADETTINVITHWQHAESGQAATR